MFVCHAAKAQPSSRVNIIIRTPLIFITIASEAAVLGADLIPAYLFTSMTRIFLKAPIYPRC